MKRKRQVDELRAAKIAEEERVKREKLQAALQTAGAVCHEMNQPLQVIFSMSDAALEDIEASHPVHQGLGKRSTPARKKMARITKKLNQHHFVSNKELRGRRAYPGLWTSRPGIETVFRRIEQPHPAQ